MSAEIVQILTEQSKAIGRIEGKLTELTGNGKPGLIQEMREDIDSLKDSRSHIRGYAAGFAGSLALLEVGMHYFAKKLGIGN
jgi:hypothetical protein